MELPGNNRKQICLGFGNKTGTASADQGLQFLLARPRTLPEVSSGMSVANPLRAWRDASTLAAAFFVNPPLLENPESRIAMPTYAK